MVELLWAHLADWGLGLSDYPTALEEFFAYVVQTEFDDIVTFTDFCSASDLQPSAPHRYNPFGDRQLNRALHLVVVHRMRRHDETRAYVQRRRAEGKTDREIRRCLKRYVARDFYRRLEQPLDKQ